MALDGTCNEEVVCRTALIIRRKFRRGRVEEERTRGTRGTREQEEQEEQEINPVRGKIEAIMDLLFKNTEKIPEGLAIFNYQMK